MLSNPEMPRKLMRPKLASGTVPGVSSAKFDQRAPLMGNSLIEVWFMLLEKSCCVVLMTGADPVAFSDVGASGEIFNVDSGQITRRG